MLKTEDLLLSLVRKGALGEDDTASLGLSTSERELLYSMASAHDIAHIVGGFLAKTGDLADDTPSKQFQKAVNVSRFRYVQMENALSCVASLLEEGEIPFIPLKGAVIRYLYPDPALRSSCDIDILVKKEDLKRAVQLLAEKGGYTVQRQGTAHDISLFSVDRVHIELHYDLMDMDERMASALGDPWQSACPKEGKRFLYVFSQEMLVTYHIVHMAKHFVFGGCGIRPLLDLHILHRRLSFDKATVEEKLSQAGLLLFYHQMTHLSQVWFGDETHTDLTREMQCYLLRGGVYGTVQNHAQNSVAKRGRVRHFLRQLFPPATYIKKRYPKAKKHPILLPWFYLWRLLCFLCKPHAKEKLKVNFEVAKAGVTEESRRSLWMMQELGMDRTELL